jgi:Zn-dependent peptidase ImmA (M78 family)
VLFGSLYALKALGINKEKTRQKRRNVSEISCLRFATCLLRIARVCSLKLGDSNSEGLPMAERRKTTVASKYRVRAESSHIKRQRSLARRSSSVQKEIGLKEASDIDTA